MYTRREMLHTTLASVAAVPFASTGAAWAAAGPEVARIKGVRMAVQSASFTFSGLALPDIFKTLQALGLKEIDIMSEHIEQFLGAPGIQLPGTGRQGPWTRPEGAPPPAPPPAAAPSPGAPGAGAAGAPGAAAGGGPAGGAPSGRVQGPWRPVPGNWMPGAPR